MASPYTRQSHLEDLLERTQLGLDPVVRARLIADFQLLEHAYMQYKRASPTRCQFPWYLGCVRKCLARQGHQHTNGWGVFRNEMKQKSFEEYWLDICMWEPRLLGPDDVPEYMARLRRIEQQTSMDLLLPDASGSVPSNTPA